VPVQPGPCPGRADRWLPAGGGSGTSPAADESILVGSLALRLEEASRHSGASAQLPFASSLPNSGLQTWTLRTAPILIDGLR
jgi:hypothetical protein